MGWDDTDNDDEVLTERQSSMRYKVTNRIKKLENENRLLTEQNRIFREALERCVKWIEPTMKGFSIPRVRQGKPTSRVIVLEFAKTALTQADDAGRRGE